MSETIRRLLAHMRWADQRVLEALRRADPPPPKALEIFAHVLGAEHVWLSRLRQAPAGVAVWPKLDVEGCARLARETAEGFESLLSGLTSADLARAVPYRNSAGQEFESTMEDMLLQVATHGCYHRGQVALLLREAGAVPEPTDYIALARGVPAATRQP